MQQKVERSTQLALVNASSYDVVFLVGGWGASFDFFQSTALAKVVTAAYARCVISRVPFC